MDQVTEAAYEYGSIRSAISAVVGTIIAIVLIFLGVLSIRNHNKNKYTTAIVKKSSCHFNQFASNNLSNNNNNNNYICIVDIEYNVKGIKYTNTIHADGNINYSPGQNINISYDSTNPKNSQLANKISSTTAGIILILMGLFVIGISWGSFYLVRHYRGYGIATGITDIIR